MYASEIDKWGRRRPLYVWLFVLVVFRTASASTIGAPKPPLLWQQNGTRVHPFNNTL